MREPSTYRIKVCRNGLEVIVGHCGGRNIQNASAGYLVICCGSGGAVPVEVLDRTGLPGEVNSGYVDIAGRTVEVSDAGVAAHHDLDSTELDACRTGRRTVHYGNLCIAADGDGCRAGISNSVALHVTGERNDVELSAGKNGDVDILGVLQFALAVYITAEDRERLCDRAAGYGTGYVYAGAYGEGVMLASEEDTGRETRN